VAPLALVQYRGRWLLHAREDGTQTNKSFLLSRIVGEVKVTAKSFPKPPEHQAEEALKALDEFWQQQTAKVRVERGSDAATRLGKRRGTAEDEDGVLTLHYSDLNLFADELASYGPEALVVSPSQLREAVRARLERTAADHG
jgi:proteasome accessory factor B